MIKTLLITPSTIYPPKGGAALRNWQHIHILRQLGPVTVYSISALEQQTARLEGCSWRHHRLTQRSTPKFLQPWLEFIRPPRWWMYPFLTNLTAPDAISDLERTLDTLQPDVAIMDRSHLYGYVPVLRRNNVNVIWDTHNIQSVLAREMASTNRGLRPALLSHFAIQRLQELEAEVAAQASQVWVCSDQDAERLLRACAKPRDVRVVPNAIDVSYYRDVKAVGSSRDCVEHAGPHLLFAGVLSYHPNRLAAETLLEDIYPLVRSILPRACCTVVGRDPSQKMLAVAARDSTVQLTGTVDDIRPFLSDADVIVVPLAQGGGTRLKIIEAFAAGRPVVCTRKAAEGLSVRDGRHLLLAESPPAVAAAIARFWFDQDLRSSIVRAAYDLVAEKYSWDAIAPNLKAAVKACVAVPKRACA